MRRKWPLFGLSVVLLVSNAFDAAAKPRQWQDATVIGEGGLSGSSVGIVQALYWIKTHKITYVIPNYSKGLIMQRWLVLPADGHTQIAVAGRDIHILDVEGKDRVVRVVWTITTKP